MKAYAKVQLDGDLKPENAVSYGTGSSIADGVFTANTVLHTIEGALLFFAVPIAILAIITAGLQMVKGGHESEEIDKAKNNLKWSIIGLLLIILSYSLVKIVITFTIKAAETA